MTILGKQLEKPGKGMAKKAVAKSAYYYYLQRFMGKQVFLDKKAVFRGFRGKGNEIW